MYTDIKTITCKLEYLRTRSSEWNEFVKKHCENSKGCSSDLNYFNTHDEADLSLKRILDKYSGDNTYQIKIGDF